MFILTKVVCSNFKPLFGSLVAPFVHFQTHLLPFFWKNFLAIMVADFPLGDGGHSGPKWLILAPQDIPDISGYQLGFGCRFVKAYSIKNPVTNKKIL